MSQSYHAVQLPLFPTKICTGCHVEKLLNPDFPISRTKRSGYDSRCKECNKARTKAWQQANRERERERVRAYQARDPEYWRQRRHENYLANKQRHQESCIAWQRANPEKAEAIRTRWYKNNPKQAQAWGRAHPEKRREAIARRRAVKKQTTTEQVNYQRILERCNNVCYICEQPLLPDQKVEFDHVIPLSRGGTHTEENIKPTHRRCNRRKSDKLISEMTPFQRRGP